MPHLIGQTLQHGKYTLEQMIGQGGFGITYRATHQVLAQSVVIKTLNESLRNKPEFGDCHRKFLDEARRLARCTHPNIVRVSDFFVENELPFIVMDYIPGQTLDQVVQPHQPMPEAIALRYIRQVGAALTVVHQNGLLHRDVKPQNLILRSDTQEVILIDFGIAREFTLGATQTHTGMISAGYAPIEQYLPQAKRTPATDVYGLAATLYTLLTGRVPVASVLRDRTPMPTAKEVRPELSASVSEAVIRGMAMDARHRPDSIAAWLALLPGTHSGQAPQMTQPASFDLHSMSEMATVPMSRAQLPQPPNTEATVVFPAQPRQPITAPPAMPDRRRLKQIGVGGALAASVIVPAILAAHLARSVKAPTVTEPSPTPTVSETVEASPLPSLEEPSVQPSVAAPSPEPSTIVEPPAPPPPLPEPENTPLVDEAVSEPAPIENTPSPEPSVVEPPADLEQQPTDSRADEKREERLRREAEREMERQLRDAERRARDATRVRPEDVRGASGGEGNDDEGAEAEDD